MLNDQVAIVTGAAQGMGREIAVTLARAGAKVVVTDLIDASETLRDIQAAGSTGAFVEGDVTLPKGRQAAVDEAIRSFGKLDILVNNAGALRKVDFFDMTPDEFDWVFDVNMKAAFFMMQAAALEMRKAGGGRIVNIASIAGKGYRNTTNIGYAGAKGGLITMTRVAAALLGKFGITANTLCPGFTETGMVMSWIERQSTIRGVSSTVIRDEITREIPLNRTNTAADVAAAVLFLASPQSRNITGQSLNLDGGLVWD